ncbi:MAG: NFACT family protein [Firmicutes bacterium]|nr:NFACT family protein [Bacillota bacterium]
MPYDGLFAAAARAELHKELSGARIHKIHQPDGHTIVLQCRQPGRMHQLLISCDPQHPRAYLTGSAPPHPVRPPAFCMLLRKHLEPARIAAVEQAGLDRVLRIVCEAVQGPQARVRRVLVAELTGRHGNIVLVDGESGRVLDAIRRRSAGEMRGALAPGEPYEPPPAKPKADPRSASPQDIQLALLRAPAAWPVERALMELYDGLGPFAAREVAARAGVPVRAQLDALSADDLDQISRALASLGDAVRSERFSPVVLRDEAGRAQEFWAFEPFGAQEATMERCTGPSEAADAYYRERLDRLAREQWQKRLQRVVSDARERLVRKAAALEQDMAQAQRAGEFRLYGELLLANLHRIERGSQATVPNYHAGGAPVTIPLDPALSVAENAHRYYKRYAKARTAKAKLESQLAAVRADIAYLDQTAVHLEMAEGREDLQAIEAELIAAGFLSPASEEHAKRRPSEAPVSLGPLEARTSDGSRVLIGRNNRQNDRLTLKEARPDDIWLHVKDAPGAHVILKPASPEPSPEALLEAARAAAYFSKARGASNVPVDWTRARYVRKPRGARPGMVIYDHHRTLYVTPDEAAVQAWLAMSRR